VIEQETEARAAARVRRVRARAALRAAPETAARLRAVGVPSDGRTEADVLPEWRTPLMTDVVDAADALFVALRDWAEIWAARLKVQPPAPGAWMRRDGTPMGFRAGTSPEVAALLVTSAAGWLLIREETISETAGAAEYETAVARAVWSWRSAAGMATRRLQVTDWTTPPRLCPVCGEDQVRAEFFGEPMEAAEARGENLLDEIAGVGVRCAHCSWQAEARPSQIARWLS
jgi:hypothetical protein